MNPYESGAVIDMNIGHNSATPAPIGADALREALWTCVEHNALHFGENHNTVVQGRAALAGAAHAATPKAAPPPAVQQGEPIGYLAAYEIDRLKQGHDGRLRSPKFGPSPLDSDVPVYLGPLPTAGALALVQKWRHAAGHLGLAGLASLADCADELEATLRTSRGQAPEPAAVVEPSWSDAANWLRNNYQDYPNIASLCEGMIAAPASQDAEDAARLDYLIESRAIVVSDPDSAPGYWLEFISPGADRWVQIGEYPTPRAAIDAARASKEGGRSMTNTPTRGSLMRKIELLEKQIQTLKSMRLIDAQSWRDMARRCTEAEVRVRCALAILQTGELPEGVEK